MSMPDPAIPPAPNRAATKPTRKKPRMIFNPPLGIYKVEVRFTDDHERLDMAGMSLPLGIDEAALKARATAGEPVPREWIQQFRRRVREAATHGCDGVPAMMAFWAERDHGAQLLLEFISE